MLSIGITGGIGSGKTTVCKIFEILGVPVYNADERAKYLMTHNKALIKKIKNIFGSNSYLKNGDLNRKYIAQIVFKNRQKLEILNKAVHPIVKLDFTDWVKKQNSEYLIKEAALLFETGSYRDMDFNVLIYSPIELRIERVMKRDNTDRDSVLARVKNQMEEEKKSKLADFIIKNDGKHSLIEQILNLDKKFKEINAKIR